MLGLLLVLSIGLGGTPAVAGPAGAGPEVSVGAVDGEGRAAVVSVEAVHADVRTVLRALASVGKVNVVFADGAEGRVTVSLRDVPFADAMEVIARSAGLGLVPLGPGRVRVAKP